MSSLTCLFRSRLVARSAAARVALPLLASLLPYHRSTRLLLSTSAPHLYAAKPPTGPLKNDTLLAHLLSSPPRRGGPSAPSAADPTVFYIDESGKDQGLHSLRTLLSSTDRSTYDLIQVASRPNPSPGASPPTIPIVKLVSRKAQYDKLKSAAAAKKASTPPDQTEKEVQVGTKVAPADLAVKANKAKDFLAKGYRVKLTVVHKPGSPRGSKQEVMQELMGQVQPLVASVVKHPHEIGRNWSAIVVGKRPPAGPASADKVDKAKGESGVKEP